MQIRLKALRVNEGLSLEEMAQKLHVGKSTLSRWERGEMRIPVAAFEEYCSICHADQDTIKKVRNNTKLRKERKDYDSRNEN